MLRQAVNLIANLQRTFRRAYAMDEVRQVCECFIKQIGRVETNLWREIGKATALR